MRIEFVISLRSSFSFRREWRWKRQFAESGNERSPWPEDTSRMTRRNELTGSFLIPFWQDSSLLLRLPANAICVAVFYRVTMPNVQCRFLRSIKKQKRQGRWRGKLSRLPFHPLTWLRSRKSRTCCWATGHRAFILLACMSIRSWKKSGIVALLRMVATRKFFHAPARVNEGEIRASREPARESRVNLWKRT